MVVKFQQMHSLSRQTGDTQLHIFIYLDLSIYLSIYLYTYDYISMYIYLEPPFCIACSSLMHCPADFSQLRGRRLSYLRQFSKISFLCSDSSCLYYNQKIVPRQRAAQSWNSPHEYPFFQKLQSMLSTVHSKNSCLICFVLFYG